MTKIIDSHVHFWDPQALRYGWLDDIEPLNQPFLPHDLSAASHGVEIEGIIFVQADCLPEQGITEARWVASLAKSDSRIRGIVAFAPLETPECEAVLQELATIPLVKGVRRLIQSEPLGFAQRPEFVNGVQSLKVYNFSFDLCIRHPQLPDVIALVRQCPDVKFVLDHIGKPDIAGQQLDPWREQLKRLADFPNVWCKLSGMITEADHTQWTVADLKPYVDHVLEVFGSERVMFGSDWPVVNLAGSYMRWLEALTILTSSLSEADEHRLFVENAARFYRLD